MMNLNILIFSDTQVLRQGQVLGEGYSTVQGTGTSL